MRHRQGQVVNEAPSETPHVFTPQAIALVEAFALSQPFALDPFQIEAAQHLAEGRSVLVAAPTGTGKTVVAEFGIWQARRAGQRAIYTAPLKALSNQKFRDLRARYGEGEVGLLTGDVVEHPRAPIVVMTTEIYRNMLLEGCRTASAMPAEDTAAQPQRESPAQHVIDADVVAADDVAELARQAALDDELSTVGCVIFDELHYLSDPQRGPVWEEAIIHSPSHVTFIGLSATVSNADELRRWIAHVHGPMALVFHTERSVPLEHYFFLDTKLHLVRNAAGARVARFPNIGGEAKLARMRGRARRYADESMPTDRRPRLAYTTGENGTREETGGKNANDGQPPQAEEPQMREAPEPGEVLTALRAAGLLPCLYFLPGRRAVETAAESAKGHLLVDPEDRVRLHAEVQEWVRKLPPEDQKLEQVQRLAALLPRGLAYHHAGLLPVLKIMVETLFQRGKLKAVFATDTLALGINMPARSVVLGSLSKFDGVQMRLLTPNEYQQLTGRAGRRGMDAKGAAVLLYSPWDAFEPAFAMLTGTLLPVSSAFTIRYNSILNLWRPGDLDRLQLAVAASLKEFQRRGGSGQRRSEVTYDIARVRSSKQERERQPAKGYRLSRAAQAELNGTITTLRRLAFIGRNDELTVKGRLLRSIFHPAGIVLADLLAHGALENLNPAELAEVISWFTFDDDRPLRNREAESQRMLEVRREIYAAFRRVLEVEYEEGLALTPMIVDDFHGVALNWHRGFSLGGLLRRIDLAEGDLLVALNQTIDLLQQLQSAVGQTLDARDLWVDAGKETRYGRYLDEVRRRLMRLRPVFDTAWRGMLRGSVAQSRAIPSMATPNLDVLPAIAMAEDEDPAEARADRVEMDTAEREAQA
jgi:superfamily II RNA helicase